MCLLSGGVVDSACHSSASRATAINGRSHRRPTLETLANEQIRPAADATDAPEHQPHQSRRQWARQWLRRRRLWRLRRHKRHSRSLCSAPIVRARRRLRSDNGARADGRLPVGRLLVSGAAARWLFLSVCARAKGLRARPPTDARTDRRTELGAGRFNFGDAGARTHTHARTRSTMRSCGVCLFVCCRRGHLPRQLGRLRALPSESGRATLRRRDHRRPIGASQLRARAQLQRKPAPTTHYIIHAPSADREELHAHLSWRARAPTAWGRKCAHLNTAKASPIMLMMMTRPVGA